MFRTGIFLGFVLVILCAFLADTGSVDFQINYTPFFTKDTTQAERYVVDMKKRLEADLAAIKNPDRNITSDLKDIYTYRYDEAKRTLKEGDVLLDKAISPYLHTIMDEIFAANPQLDTNIRLLVHRTGEANASSWGEGSVFFNLGLISRLENESQVAFVLCHELAHYYAQHSYKGLLKNLTRVYSKETKDAIRQASRTQYGMMTQYQKLLDSFYFGFSRHSRDNESEADSLALLYMKNTKFDAAEAIGTMKILDIVDTAKYRQNIDLKKHFNSPAFPYKSMWSEYSKSEMIYAKFEDREDADSLKTHPDCKKRIVSIERQLKAMSYSSAGKKKFMTTEAAYNNFVERTDFELVESAFHHERYGLALYRALLLLDKYPNNIYLHAVVGGCFYYIHKYQQEHELGNYVVQPDSRMDENYDRLLTFVHQLRLSEVAGIGFHYMQRQPAAYMEDENFLHAYYLCSKMNNSAEDISRTKKKYLDTFPDGKYKKDFE